MKNTVLLLTNHTDDSTNSVITNLKKLGQRFYLLAQEYVDKDFELRITIVGEKIFTCAICSQEIEQTKIDWRNNNLENIKHGPYELPPDIKAKIFALMRRWHLSFRWLRMQRINQSTLIYIGTHDVKLVSRFLQNTLPNFR